MVGRCPVTVALIRRSAGAIRIRRCKLSTSMPRCPVWRQPCRDRGASTSTTASLAVQPEGTLTVRTAALDLSIATETEHCNNISFDSASDPATSGTLASVVDLELTATGDQSADLVAHIDTPSQPWMDGGADGQGRHRPLLHGLIPAKYNVDVETQGGDVELGFLEGAATIDTRGGNIRVDKITSAEIRLASAGGDVAARVLQGIVEISDAGAVCIQRCVSPTVSIAAVGPVDCAAMYADSYHITTGTSTQGDTSANGAEGGDHSLNDDELGQREGSVTLGSSHTKFGSTITTRGAAVYIGSQEGEGPITIDSHGGDVTIKLSRQVGAVTVNSGGGNITVKAASDLFMRLEVLRAAGDGRGIHIDANHSFTPDENSTAVLRGDVNYQQTMTEWAQPTVDTFQVDVADRFVPKTGPSGDDDKAAPVLLLLDAGGGAAEAGRIELLVGGWLDDILSGVSSTYENENSTKRNSDTPCEAQLRQPKPSVDYFGPRNKA